MAYDYPKGAYECKEIQWGDNKVSQPEKFQGGGGGDFFMATPCMVSLCSIRHLCTALGTLMFWGGAGSTRANEARTYPKICIPTNKTDYDPKFRAESEFDVRCERATRNLEVFSKLVLRGTVWAFNSRYQVARSNFTSNSESTQNSGSFGAFLNGIHALGYVTECENIRVPNSAQKYQNLT